MKVKIKGLVFVGFAAMIFAANAMAAPAAAGNQNTVTSKAYTEATYQHKSTEASIGSTEGRWTPVDTEVADGATSVPTTAAVKEYVDQKVADTGATVQNGTLTVTQNGSTIGTFGANQGTNATIALTDTTYTGGSNITITGADNAIAATTGAVADGATTLVTGDAVYDAIAAQHTTDNTTYQAYSNAANRVSDGNGGWKALGTTLDTTDTQNYDANNAVTAGTIAAALAAQPGATEYTGGNLITVNDHEISTTAQVNVLEGVKVNGTALNIDTTDKTVNLGAAAGKGADTTISDQSTDANVPTSAAVYDYVQSQTGGTVIPAMDTAKCSATIPCALVAEADGEVHWRVMAVAEGQNPAAGTLADAPANP